MAKALPAAVWLARAVEKLGSQKAVAERIGRSPQTLSDVKSGKNSGDALRDSLRAVAQGKADVPLPAPTPKQVAKARERGQKAIETKQRQERIKKLSEEVRARRDPIERAESALKALDAGGVEKVMIHVTSPKTGDSFTLGANGGIWVDTIRSAGSLQAFVTQLAGKQHYSFDASDMLLSIDFEEYY